MRFEISGWPIYRRNAWPLQQVPELQLEMAIHCLQAQLPRRIAGRTATAGAAQPRRAVVVAAPLQEQPRTEQRNSTPQHSRKASIPINAICTSTTNSQPCLPT
ncbi:hypothetical protein L917_02112 [Phytophthora nicotianae]|uniref:Uncharacterized protein n=1 Tax=Phytophthora nicotianae TaxID=4792 RepID=W2P3G2_PHYNI|nr:hypothetical protein L917_02112 [Phytophthora nicotianae]ETM54474.1 hypothetical protein L914_02201 [Phytophthora nicotianae]